MDKWERLKNRLTGLRSAYKTNEENHNYTTFASKAVELVQEMMEELESEVEGI
jgi:hypothetical protein